MSWTERLQNISRRRLYLALFIAVAIPVFTPLRPPVPMTQEARGVYDAIEQIPPGRLVMVHSTWDAGTIGECEGQCHALVVHLMRKGVPFIVWTSNPTAPPFYNRILSAAAKKYGRVYGRDWADFGYKVPGGQLGFGIQSMARDFPGFMKADVFGTPVAQIPVTRNVKDASAFGLALSIGYVPTTEFIPFMQAVYGTKVAFAMAAIYATSLYTYIDSRQIVGMLVGARGGAEYEVKMNAPGKGVDIIVAQSFAHLLIILLVVMANVALLLQRRAGREESA